MWGAQGGGYNETDFKGGYGGYSLGYINLEKGTKLYITVGGSGKYIGQYDTGIGGYNGGGSIKATWNDTNEKRSTGGGATHIAFKSGELKTLKDEDNNPFLDDILIVAGGGGASQVNSYDTSKYWGHGGSGGGYIGVSGSGANLDPSWYQELFYDEGGTQEDGGTPLSGIKGSFGQGGDCNNGNCSGGGGGYYGGASSLRGAGGGSGYIGNTLLTDKVMYCYECEESTDTNTKTISTTNVSKTPISNHAKIGDGYARITYVK